jgi:hypothetical protein
MSKYLLAYFALLALVAGAATPMLADTGALRPMAPASPEGQPAGPPIVTSLPGPNASAIVSPTASVAFNGPAYGGLTKTSKALRHFKKTRAAQSRLRSAPAPVSVSSSIALQSPR